LWLLGEIGQILKARVTDTNKAVQNLALDVVSRIATGMGKAFERHSRLFALPVSTVLSDQKATIRSAALQTLTAMAGACEGIESMVPGLTTALETTNPLQKATLFQWIVDWFKDHDASFSLDINPWATLVVSSLDDRSSDVRKAAQALLPTVIQCAGFDFVMQQTNSLKPASRSGAVRLVQAAKPATVVNAPNSTTAGKASTPSGTSPLPPPPESPPVTTAFDNKMANTQTIPDNKPTNKGLGVRRKLPQGISRPDSRADNSDGATKPIPISNKPMTSTTKAQTANSVPEISSLPFTAVNPDVKKARLMKDVNRWVNEGGPTRKDLAELLQSQMEPCTSKHLVARLFSHDHNAVNDHIDGLGLMADFYSEAIGANENIEKLCIVNLDLPLKYISIKVHEPQPNLISKCLDVVEAVLAFLRQINYRLSDNEAMCFVPTMIYKVRYFFLLSTDLLPCVSLVMPVNKFGCECNKSSGPFRCCTHTAEFFRCCWITV
jgi:cytoskeleton-associated protein 5